MTDFTTVRFPVVIARKGEPAELSVSAFMQDSFKQITNASANSFSLISGQPAKQQEIAGVDGPISLSVQDQANFVKIGECASCQHTLLAHSELADAIEESGNSFHCTVCSTAFTPKIDISELITAMGKDASDQIGQIVSNYDPETDELQDDDDLGDVDTTGMDDDGDYDDDAGDDMADEDDDAWYDTPDDEDDWADAPQDDWQDAPVMETVMEGEEPADADWEAPILDDPMRDSRSVDPTMAKLDMPMDLNSHEKIKKAQEIMQSAPLETINHAPSHVIHKYLVNHSQMGCCNDLMDCGIKHDILPAGRDASGADRFMLSIAGPCGADAKPMAMADAGKPMPADTTPPPAPAVDSSTGQPPATIIAKTEPAPTVDAVPTKAIYKPSPIENNQPPRAGDLDPEAEALDATEKEPRLVINLASGVDFSKGQLDLIQASVQGQPVYHVFHQGMPIAILHKSQAAADLQDLFAKEQFVQAFKIAASKGLETATAKRFGFKPVTHKLTVEQAANQAVIQSAVFDQVKAAQEQAKLDFDNRMAALKQGIGIAAVASVKGVWEEFRNPLRDALVASLQRLGTFAPEQTVDKVFAEHSQDFMLMVLSKGQELAEKSPEMRNEIASFVEKAKFNMTVQVSASPELSSRLNEGSLRLIVPSEPEITPLDFADRAKSAMSRFARR